MKNFDVSRLFQIIFACVFALSAFMVVFLLLRAYREQKAFENLAEMVDKNIGVPEDLSSEMPESEEVSPYIRLKEQNDDFYGWISIEGTRVDYPVMHTPDNPEYYLRRGFDGNWAESGVPFMSAECFDGCGNYLIHGHNMKNGTMFHDLMNYKQKSFFDEHRIIDLLWDGVETQWEIFVAYIIKPNTIYHISTAFTDDQHFADVMNQTIEYAKTVKPSNADPDVTIKPSDQVLTLSTCTYEYDDSFFAVMARRIK